MSAHVKQLGLFKGFFSLDVGVKKSGWSAFMAKDVGNLVFEHGLPLDGGNAEYGIFSINLVSFAATLGVVEDFDVLTCPINAD